MEDPDYLDNMQRITARMNQVHVANALVRKGQFSEALQLLRNVREKYTEPSMIRQIELLIRDVQARAAVPGAGLEPMTTLSPPPAATPRPSAATPRPSAATPRPSAATPRPASMTETRHVSRSGATPRPDAAGSALARARSDLASAEATIARARAAVERSVKEQERERDAGVKEQERERDAGGGAAGS